MPDYWGHNSKDSISKETKSNKTESLETSSESSKPKILSSVPDYWNYNSKVNTTSECINVEKSELSSDNYKETLLSTLSSSSDVNITENKNKLDNTVQKKEIMDNPILVSNNTKTLSKESASENCKQTPTKPIAELESAECISYIWEYGD